jgi:phage baseplate assembly protein W
MAQTFIGFNTQGQFKKFTLTGFDLIKRDLLNALNIRQGQLPGRPGYGTVIWDFLFEPQLESVQLDI